MRLRLTLSIIEPEDAVLIDQLVPEQRVPRGLRGVRNWWSPDISTPMGVPLKAWVHFSDEFGQFIVYTDSGATELFRVDGVYAPFVGWMLLSTEERLRVSIKTE